MKARTIVAVLAVFWSVMAIAWIISVQVHKAAEQRHRDAVAAQLRDATPPWTERDAELDRKAHAEVDRILRERDGR